MVMRMSIVLKRRWAKPTTKVPQLMVPMLLLAAVRKEQERRERLVMINWRHHALQPVGVRGIRWVGCAEKQQRAIVILA